MATTTSSPARRVHHAPSPSRPAPRRRGEVALLAERAGMALARTLLLSLVLAWVLTSKCWFPREGEKKDNRKQREFFLAAETFSCASSHFCVPRSSARCSDFASALAPCGVDVVFHTA